MKVAVTKRVSGIELSKVGVVLMFVGAVGPLLALIFMAVRRRSVPSNLSSDVGGKVARAGSVGTAVGDLARALLERRVVMMTRNADQVVR